MTDSQLLVKRLTEILEVDFSWYEECKDTWESEGDCGWIAGALSQADESAAVRAAVSDVAVEDALNTVALMFGWERPGDDEDW